MTGPQRADCGRQRCCRFRGAADRHVPRWHLGHGAVDGVSLARSSAALGYVTAGCNRARCPIVQLRSFRAAVRPTACDAGNATPEPLSKREPDARIAHDDGTPLALAADMLKVCKLCCVALRNLQRCSRRLLCRHCARLHAGGSVFAQQVANASHAAHAHRVDRVAAHRG